MEEKFFSIKEFAEEVGKSEQSVYKRIKKANDPIQNYIKLRNGKKVISAAAVCLYNGDVNEYEEIGTEEKPLPDTDIITLLKEQIEEQRKEIEFKNKQLEDLTEQLKASSERETNYQTLLNQQQQLTAAAEKKEMLLLEEKSKKKGFFSRFKKKGTNEQ